MGRIRQEKSVIVSLWSAGSCGRKQLAGVLRYINAGHPWSIRIIMDPRNFTPKTIREAERDGVDGLIAFTPPETVPALAATKIPTVLLSFPLPTMNRRRHGLAMFINDNEEIGARGAEYFLSLGAFASYAFVPDVEGRGWSRLRERGFRERLTRAGLSCRSYNHVRKDLAAWLRELPKPAAVMTPFDFRAKDVVEACRATHISVPEDLAILGVDDDELICESTRPSISSIRLDQEKIGYKAAETLNRLMSATRPTPSERIQLTSGAVIERESTRPISPTVHLVNKIKACIGERFAEDLSVDEIAAFAGVSRRLADLRFSAATGTSIRRALEDRRLKEIQRRLADSKLPIAKITRLAGYSNDLWVKYVFKKRFGLSMSDWRKENAKT